MQAKSVLLALAMIHTERQKLLWGEKASRAAAWRRRQQQRRLYEGVLHEQLEDVVLVLEFGHIDGRLPVQVLQHSDEHHERSPAGRLQALAALYVSAGPLPLRTRRQGRGGCLHARGDPAPAASRDGAARWRWRPGALRLRSTGSARRGWDWRTAVSWRKTERAGRDTTCRGGNNTHEARAFGFAFNDPDGHHVTL